MCDDFQFITHQRREQLSSDEIRRERGSKFILGIKNLMENMCNSVIKISFDIMIFCLRWKNDGV